MGGGCFIFLLYAVILFRVGVISRKTLKTDHLNPRGRPDIFPALLVFGLGLSVVLQALFHMGVNVGALPVTGQTLPLISMGGTSLWFTSAALGIILNVAYSFSPEGQLEEENKLKARSEKTVRKRKARSDEEDWEEEMVDEIDNGELPEIKSESLETSVGRRRSRRPVEKVEVEDDIDIIGEGGIPDIEDQLESEGEKVVQELRRKGRRGGIRDEE